MNAVTQRCIKAFMILSLIAASSVSAAEGLAEAEKKVLALAKAAISLRSVRGEDNQTQAVAVLFRDALLDGGWSSEDIEIVPLEDTAYFIATWPGTDPSLGPIVISAHMDVVEAKREDWERDPFQPVVENGYLYGRGASDTKFDAAQALIALIELRRQGFTPRRTIKAAFSGDEETTMHSSKLIADRLRHAALVLNVDGAAGVLDEETGQPSYWSWQGAEKTYADFELVITNPGGHSSAPRADNAIAQMSGVLARIAKHRFKPELNDITRDYLTQSADLEPDLEKAAMMRAFVQNPVNPEAVAALRNDPALIGVIGTTCVPTMVDGGHARNALPQRVTAIVNCRIFPGHEKAEIASELRQVAAQTRLEMFEVDADFVVTAPASPFDERFVGAVTQAIGLAFGDMPIIASQASGATDSMWYRALGIPSYGASGTFLKMSDDYSHGLNERVPTGHIQASLLYYTTLLAALASD
jgi:carboxypeptidase PM20D1